MGANFKILNSKSGRFDFFGKNGTFSFSKVFRIIGVWLLKTGFWDDSGVWDDTAIWKDNP